MPIYIYIYLVKEYILRFLYMYQKTAEEKKVPCKVLSKKKAKRREERRL